MKPLNVLLTSLLLTISIGLFAQDVKELPVAVKPSDAKIKYVGRFDNSNPAGQKCSWSASNVTIKFTGTAANVKMTSKKGDRWQVEVIGDSISCGYGNEANKKEEHFSPATENAYKTYGAIAARELDADYVCIAWSGKRMWPKNTIPELHALHG